MIQPEGNFGFFCSQKEEEKNEYQEGSVIFALRKKE